MKILRLKAENFKRLEVVDITPKGSMVKISGPNAAGKSSVLDAVIAALGGKTMRPKRPIRTGQSSAKIMLDLGGEKVETSITLTFKEGAPDELTIVPMRQGFTAQKFLDYLVSAISFDPLHFAGLKPKEQFDILKQIVPLKDSKGKALDPVQIDFMNGEDFKARALLNRQVKELDARHSVIEVPQGTPDEPVDVSAIAKQISQASEHNAGLEVARQRRSDAVARVEKNVNLAAQKQEELKKALAQAEADELRFRKELSELRAVQKQAELAKPIDTSKLQEQIDAAGTVNRNVADKQRKKEITAEALAAQFASDDLSNKMEGRTAEKMEALKKAKFPVPGLSFGSEEVLYNGLPFEQASTAEKLTVSLAIGMHMNAELRVMLIKEGTLLDEKSFSIVERMAEKWGGQIWCEVVDTSGEIGVVMTEGHVAAGEELAGIQAAYRKTIGTEKGKGSKPWDFDGPLPGGKVNG